MALSGIRTISQSFGEDRVLFESFNEANDINPENGKFGVRSHHWFTAFFLRIFGMIIDIPGDGDQIYHLNKSSLDKWRGRYAKAFGLICREPEGLPTIGAIVANHKNAIAKQKNEIKQNILELKKKEELEIQKKELEIQRQLKIEAKNKEKELKGAITLQKHIRGYLAQKHFEKIKGAKQEIEQLKTELGTFQEKEKSLLLKKADLIITQNSLSPLGDKIEEANKEFGGWQSALIEQNEKLIALEQKAKEKEESPVQAWFQDLFNKAKQEVLKEEIVAEQTIEEAQGEIDAIVDNLAKAKEKLSILNDLKEEKEFLLLEMPKIDVTLSKLATEIAEMQNLIAEKNAALDKLLIEKGQTEVKDLSINTSEKPALLFDEEPALKEQEAAKIEAPSDAANPIGETEDPSAQALLQEVVLPNVSHAEVMLADIAKYAHPELAKIMQTIVDKFGPAIKSWECDAAGKFKLTFTETPKLWLRSKLDTGEIDSRIPKGVVYLFGKNKEKEIAGTLDSKKCSISLSKGIETYCEYKKKIGFWDKQGIVDGVVTAIAYDPNNQNISFHAKGTDRALNMAGSDVDTKKLSTLLKNWNDGEKIPEANDHEAYLAAKAS